MLLNDRWLLMEDNKVINMIIWNGGDWSPPRGCSIIPEPKNLDVCIGWELTADGWKEPKKEE